MVRGRLLCGLVLLSAGRLKASQLSLNEQKDGKDQALTFVAFLTSQDGVVICAGTVIHARFVLTAAGCFHTSTGDMISYQHKVLIGNDFKTIDQLLPHPAFRVASSFYDIGLIRLTDTIQFNLDVTRIKMAVREHLEIGDVMKTTCWKMRHRRRQLKEEATHVIMRSLCGKSAAPFISSSSVCARVYNTCEVIIGSPLYTGGKIYGVATRRRHRRSMYMKVNKVRAWIVNVLFGDNMEDYWGFLG